MFAKKGQCVVPASATTEENLMELVLEAGAEDIRQEGENFEISCAPEDFAGLQQTLEQAELDTVESGIIMEPQNVVHLDGKKADQCLKLLEMLEDHDDVQDVYANLEIDDETVASGAG
jgi:transcriptional/translational regulatory protein YebC/TACO1